jgi:hypothetical protein
MATIVGDYNSDGIVDAADYVVWGRLIGANFIPNRDPNNTGAVGNGDLISWQANFGQVFVNGAGSHSTAPAVPESTTLVLVIFALALTPWSGTLNRPRRH